MKKFDFITIGGATRDIFFKTDKDLIMEYKGPQCGHLMCFEYGKKIIPKEAFFSFGGGALNSAVAMSRLGFKVSTIINIGGEESSKSILKHLKKENIDRSLVTFSKKYYRGISIIIVDSKCCDHTAFLYRGTNNMLEIKKWDWLENTKWVYVSSLTGKSDKILKDFSQKLNKSSLKFAWNPGVTQLEKGFKGLEKLLRITDVLILNKDEAKELVLSKNKRAKVQEIEYLFREISLWGPEIIVITCGKEGAYAFFDKVIYFVSILKTKVVDTTGAGDAFGSSFVSGLEIFKGDIKEALKLASVNASSVVSYFGAQTGLLSFRKAKPKMRSLKVKEKKLKLN